MIYRVTRTYQSQNADRSLMYPGQWVETYIRVCEGVWFLIGREPYVAA